MTVKVSSKYQVVIPEQVRSVLQLKPGAKVEVMVKGKVAYIVPVRDIASVIRELKAKVDSKNIREKKDRRT